MALGILGAVTGIALVIMVLSMLVSAFFIWFSAKIFSMKDKSFVSPLIIAVLSAIVGGVLGVIGAFIPGGRYLAGLVAIVFTVWLIKTKYRTDWGKGILIWLVSAVLAWVVMLVIGVIFLGGALMTIGGLNLG